MSEIVARPAVKQLQTTVSATAATEMAMLRAVSSVLFNGTYGLNEVEALQAVASDYTFNNDARWFARCTLGWLMRNATREMTLRPASSDLMN